VGVTTGPSAPSDARLRRVQACAHQSGIALLLARELIGRKLAGQEKVAREWLRDPETAEAIANRRKELHETTTTDEIRVCEARAGAAYWVGWRGVRMQFPKKDQRRVPDHWLSFGSRTSPLVRTSLVGNCELQAAPFCP
jgi:CRISPR/Cas system-associated endonuclease Cas1